MATQNLDNSKIKVYKTTDELNTACANYIVALANNAMTQHGRFSIALSGGSTPKSLFTLLSLPPYRDEIPWQKTFVFWGDERCVSPNDDNNNAHMAKQVLLNKVNIPTSNIFPIPVQLQPNEAAKLYEKTLHNFFGNSEPCFDLMLLGLGENGHTASLFPNTGVLNETGYWVKEVFVEELDMWRITLTAQIINQSSCIIFLVAGEKKAAVVNTIVNGDYNPQKYPAQLIKPVTGELIWMLDEKAAMLLDKNVDIK